MENNLKILILEDSIDDANLIQRLLKKENMHCEFCLATDKKTFLHALTGFSPDVILSDNSMPQFNAFEALTITRQQLPFVPFILVSGTMPEEKAVNIIKQGADDYILKDRMARLPAAIETALNQRRAEKEIKDYKYALDQSAIVAITDQKGIITYANENFCKISQYSAEELIGQDHRILNSGYHDSSYIKGLWTTLASGKIWRGEFCNKAKNESIYWVDATIIPFLNEIGKPYQYLAIRIDITEQKNAEEHLKLLEREISEQKMQEQKKIARAIIRSGEKERNHMGQELHDNINQLLAGTKLFMSIAGNKNEELKELIKYPMELLSQTMEEIRLLCSKIVTPLKNVDLEELVQQLLSNIKKTSSIKTDLVYTVSNGILSDDLKLNIYRILQEQMNNILKHAEAKKISVTIREQNKSIYITVVDDGKGFVVEKNRKGIGISNMINRIATFNGKIEIESSIGKGCKTQISIPY